MISIDHSCTCRGNPLVPQACRITKITRETHDVKTFRAETLCGERPFLPLPGQLGMWSVPGVGEAGGPQGFAQGAGGGQGGLAQAEGGASLLGGEGVGPRLQIQGVDQVLDEDEGPGGGRSGHGDDGSRTRYRAVGVVRGVRISATESVRHCRRRAWKATAPCG